MTPLERDTAVPAEIEEAIDRQLRLLSPASAVERERFREEIRLQLLCPNEFVAYVDNWAHENNVLRLCRLIIAHHPEFAQAHRAIEQWREQNPDLQNEQVRVEFIGDSAGFDHPVLD